MNKNLKKNTIYLALLFSVLAVLSYANSTAETDNISFYDVQGKDWKLAEVKTEKTSFKIDRTGPSKENYTITFQANRLFGKGVDNSYSAFYTTSENHAISIGRIASSSVVPLYEMQTFTEYKYLLYLEMVNRWNVRNEKLELYTCTETDDEVVLIYY